jgi:integrase/recombinase XerD
MGALRDRMIQEMQLRGFRERTQESYLHVITEMAKHYRRSPAELSVEEVRGFVQHLIVDRKLSESTLSVWISAIKFLYGETMGRAEVCLKVPRRRKQRPLPTVLSLGEVERLLAAADEVRWRTVLMAAYSAGLRANEVVHLRVEDIDRERMTIRVAEGKGGHERRTLLSPRMARQLAVYRSESGVAQGWLFPGRDGEGPMTRQAARHMYWRASLRAGISKRGGIHVLRHSFATHLLEAGVNVPRIQMLLGHRSMKTTARYLHLAAQHAWEVASPLESLKLKAAGLGYLK